MEAEGRGKETRDRGSDWKREEGADDEAHGSHSGSLGSHENQARVSFVGTAHVTATNFVFFAGRRYMEKLQDPGLSVPGIFNWHLLHDPLLCPLKCYL